jgi:hypothetical protein
MSMTYYERILSILTESDITIEEMLIKLDLEYSKLTYVIDGLKKGISYGTIIKNANYKEKRLWLGHKYHKI